jgi:hypothetical protein
VRTDLICNTPRGGRSPRPGRLRQRGHALDHIDAYPSDDLAADHLPDDVADPPAWDDSAIA